MDSEGRTNPHDLVALSRAGQLSRERVALAADLGEAQVGATGVAPWVPPALPGDEATDAL